MKVRILKVSLILFFVNLYISAFSQEINKDSIKVVNVIDSLKKSGVVFSNKQKKYEITLSSSQALKFLQEKFNPQFWNNTDDPLRQAFGELIYQATHPALDSLRNILMKYPYDSLNLRALKVGKPFAFQKTAELKDTTILVIIDTLNEVISSYSEFPFKYFNNPFQGDSIEAAVKSLLNYLDDRDSSVIRFTGVGKTVTPIMLNSKSDKVIRYWLKNEFSDSVTIWISNPARNTIGLYLEQGVNFRRPFKQETYANSKINIKSLDDFKLRIIRNIALKSQFWKYRSEASFVLNQAALSNWVRGGENSISTALDVTGYADYNNKALKVSSNNFARIKFGYIATGKDGIRKNLDLVETNSKLNHKAFGKFDFSAILLFKTQIAKGRNYFKTDAGKDTSEVVSKFMNPAILTIGFGLDYKPNKTTSINFSPFSYKGTFVTDTDHIDQTKYGIAKNRKSLNEPGISFMITNEFNPIETVTIINRLQLFTNYIHNPQNIDVDWEMIATARLNWFTDVRFNTHLIFDDDARTINLDKNNKPVLRPDGTEKKTARIQFKEMLGISLSFRF
jgi:Protein of unknown function (DUF3078)